MRNVLDSVFSNYRAPSSMPASLECALCCSSSHSGSRWDNGWSRVPYVLALYTGGGGVWGGLGVRKPGDENWQKQLRWQQRRTCPIISSNGLSYHGAPLELVPFATFPAAIQATTLLPSRHHQSCDIEHLSNLTKELENDDQAHSWRMSVFQLPAIRSAQDRVPLSIFASAGHQEETITSYLTRKMITDN